MPGGAVQPRGSASKYSVKKPVVKKKKDQGNDESVVDRVKNFVGSVGKNWSDMLSNDSSGNGSVTGALRNAGSMAAPQIAQASGYRGKLTGAGIDVANQKSRDVANEIDSRAAMIAAAAGGAGALAKGGARAAAPAMRAAARGMEPKTVAYAATKNTMQGVGKTRAATAADTATSASKRNAEEKAAIAAGTRKARSEAGATALEKQDAAMASRKSVNAGKPSSVVPRSGTETGNVPKGATDSDLKSFVAKRATTRGGKQTPAQAKRAQADLADSLKRGSRMSREGRAPGEDIPAETGRGVNEPVPSRATPPKAQLREEASKAMKGKKAQQNLAQRNRDYSEGRRDAEGNLKGASAKSARRQQEKVDKAAGVKKPSAKVEAVAKAETPKPAASKPAAKKPSAKVDAVAKSEGAVTPKPVKAKPAAEPTPPKPGTDLVKVPSTRGQKASGPVVKSGAPRPMGGGRTKDLVVRPVSDIVEGKVLASKNALPKGGKWKGRAIKAGVTGAALGGTGLVINKANLGGGKATTSTAPTSTSSPKPATTKPAAEAKDAAQSKTKKFGPTGESRFIKGRPAVRQSVIDGFKKRGMTKSLALVKAHKDDPEYLEAVRRYYGESRLKKAMGS